MNTTLYRSRLDSNSNHPHAQVRTLEAKAKTLLLSKFCIVTDMHAAGETNNKMGVDEGGASSDADSDVDFTAQNEPCTVGPGQFVSNQISQEIMRDGGPSRLTPSYGSFKSKASSSLKYAFSHVA